MFKNQQQISAKTLSLERSFKRQPRDVIIVKKKIFEKAVKKFHVMRKYVERFLWGMSSVCDRARVWVSSGATKVYNPPCATDCCCSALGWPCASACVIQWADKFPFCRFIYYPSLGKKKHGPLNILRHAALFPQHTTSSLAIRMSKKIYTPEVTQRNNKVLANSLIISNVKNLQSVIGYNT